MSAPANAIETARLLLRMPELSDAGPFMGIFWDAEVVDRKQVTLHEPPGGLDLAEKNTTAMITQWERRGYGQWTVVEKSSGEVIGVVGFYHPKGPWPGVDLGWLIHRSRWGLGYATEAAGATVPWLWQHTAITQIVSLIAPDDERSMNVAVKIGLKFEKAIADPVHGEPAHVYTITRPV